MDTEFVFKVMLLIISCHVLNNLVMCVLKSQVKTVWTFCTQFERVLNAVFFLDICFMNSANIFCINS